MSDTPVAQRHRSIRRFWNPVESRYRMYERPPIIEVLCERCDHPLVFRPDPIPTHRHDPESGGDEAASDFAIAARALPRGNRRAPTGRRPPNRGKSFGCGADDVQVVGELDATRTAGQLPPRESTDHVRSCHAAWLL